MSLILLLVNKVANCGMGAVDVVQDDILDMLNLGVQEKVHVLNLGINESLVRDVDQRREISASGSENRKNPKGQVEDEEIGSQCCEEGLWKCIR